MATATKTVSAMEFCLRFNQLAPTHTRKEICKAMGLKPGTFASRERQYRKGLHGTPMQLKAPVPAKRGGRVKNDYAAIAAALAAQESTQTEGT